QRGAGDCLDVGQPGIHAAVTGCGLMRQVKRREFLAAGALAAGGALLSSRVTFAGTANGNKPRFVFVILRGALDGLAAVPACGDPGYAKLRGDLAIGQPGTDGGELALGGSFGL